jgi:hypothetical protein
MLEFTSNQVHRTKPTIVSQILQLSVTNTSLNCSSAVDQVSPSSDPSIKSIRDEIIVALCECLFWCLKPQGVISLHPIVNPLHCLPLVAGLPPSYDPLPSLAGSSTHNLTVLFVQAQYYPPWWLKTIPWWAIILKLTMPSISCVKEATIGEATSSCYNTRSVSISYDQDIITHPVYLCLFSM